MLGEWVMCSSLGEGQEKDKTTYSPSQYAIFYCIHSEIPSGMCKVLVVSALVVQPAVHQKQGKASWWQGSNKYGPPAFCGPSYLLQHFFVCRTRNQIQDFSYAGDRQDAWLASSLGGKTKVVCSIWLGTFVGLCSESKLFFKKSSSVQGPG